MRITSSSEYAVRIMVQLARRYGGETVTAKGLSDHENIPKDFVDQILLRLRRAGLVGSRRGVRGGFVLSREPTRVNVAAIMSAVDGGILEEVCQKYSEGDVCCCHQDDCGIRPVWVRLASVMEEFLKQVSLAQLVESEESSSKKLDIALKTSQTVPSAGPSRSPPGARGRVKPQRGATSSGTLEAPEGRDELRAT